MSAAADEVGASVSIHATAIVVGEAGILIRGRSGRGKSTLALTLLELAAERGLFARLIGDDRVLLRWFGGRLILSGAPKTLGLIERRGLGLVQAEAEPAAVARLAVDLLDEGEAAARMPEEADETMILGDTALPRLVFDGRPGPMGRARAVLAALSTKATGL